VAQRLWILLVTWTHIAIWSTNKKYWNPPNPRQLPSVPFLISTQLTAKPSTKLSRKRGSMVLLHNIVNISFRQFIARGQLLAWFVSILLQNGYDWQGLIFYCVVTIIHRAGLWVAWQSFCTFCKFLDRWERNMLYNRRKTIYLLRERSCCCFCGCWRGCSHALHFLINYYPIKQL